MVEVQPRATILIVDDDEDDRALLARALGRRGYRTTQADSGEAALRAYAQERPAVCVVDQAMPGMDGIALLTELRRRDPAAQVIIMTGFGSIDRAVAAMRAGAIDFLTKPVDEEVLSALIEKARQIDAVLAENRNLRAELEDRFSFSNIVCASPEMQRVLALAKQAARHDVTVLITGESGVGKEVVARAIHFNSARRGGRFFALNCAALPESLVESELFGHERGAFTGADRRKEGLLEQAARGTLLLDEIGDMPLLAQAKLLRVLDQREFLRVGGTTVIEVDARVIAATNADLLAAVREKRFREDLYYRLNVLAISIPPLRARRADILPLARHVLARLGREMGREPPRLSADAVEYLENAPWPGNVRELFNAVERAMIVSEDGVIRASDFPPSARREAAPASVAGLPAALEAGAPAAQRTGEGSLAEVRRRAEEMERAAIREALERSGNNLSRAARLLGMGRGALRYRLQRLGLTKQDFS